MNERRPTDIHSLRYRHLGPDPVAKQLYAVAVAAQRAYLAAAAALEQYLDAAKPERQIR